MHRAWPLWASAQRSLWAIFLGSLGCQCLKSSLLLCWKSCSEGYYDLSCGSYSSYYYYSGNKVRKMAGDLNILNINICLVWGRTKGEEDQTSNCFLKGLLVSYSACGATFIPASIGSLMSTVPEQLSCFCLSPLIAFISAFSSLSHQLPNIHLLSGFQVLLLLSTLSLSSTLKFMCSPKYLLRCCFSGVSGGTGD